jgi:hypothetical protein
MVLTPSTTPSFALDINILVLWFLTTVIFVGRVTTIQGRRNALLCNNKAKVKLSLYRHEGGKG